MNEQKSPRLVELKAFRAEAKALSLELEGNLIEIKKIISPYLLNYAVLISIIYFGFDITHNISLYILATAAIVCAGLFYRQSKGKISHYLEINSKIINLEKRWSEYKRLN